MRAAAAVAAFVLVACTAKREPAVAVAPAVIEPPPVAAPVPAEVAPSEIAWGDWTGFGPAGCAYLAPKDGFFDEEGGVDVVFHFHAGQMSDRELRASGLRAVIVSCGWGVGTAPYSEAFADPNRFDKMLRAVVKRAGAKQVRKLALVSWSAGFASISKILRVPRYYAMTDAVVLLDSLHSAYTSAGDVDVRMLDPFVRFARDAARGDKAMVITHSAIVPPGYASSTEATRAVLTAIDVPTAAREDGRDEASKDDIQSATARGMRLSYRADAGNLHVRGFRGVGPQDHFDHLHLVGEVLRSWLVVRWKTDRRLVYTAGGEER